MKPKMKAEQTTRKLKTKKVSKNLNDIPTEAAAQAKGVPVPRGATVRRSTLLQQAALSFALGVTFGELLLPANWFPRDNTGIKTDLKDFEEASQAFDVAREASKQATVAFQAVVEESIVLRNQVVAAVRVATQGKPNPFLQERLKRSQTKSPKELVVWFDAVLLEVNKNLASLKAQLGPDPVALIQSQAGKLMDAIGAQLESRQNVPDMSKRMQAARVKLAQRLERQRFAAAVAFPRNKEVLEKFVPLWDKKRAASRVSAEQPGEGAAAAAPAQAATEAAAAKPAAAASAKATS